MTKGKKGKTRKKSRKKGRQQSSSAAAQTDSGGAHGSSTSSGDEVHGEENKVSAPAQDASGLLASAPQEAQASGVHPPPPGSPSIWRTSFSEMAWKAAASTVSQPASTRGRDLLGHAARGPGASSAPQPTRRRASEAELRTQFIEFIKTYCIPGQNSPVYKEFVQKLVNGSFTRLDIDFRHILDGLTQDKKYLDMCLRIGNEVRSNWLVITFEELLETSFVQSLAGNTDRIQFISRTVDLRFTNKPESIIQLRDFLSAKSHPTARWITVLGRKNVYSSTSRGRLGFRAILSKMIEYFRQDKWFDVDLDIDDLFMINSRACYIAKMERSLSSLQEPDHKKAKEIMANGKLHNLHSL
ncbi:hypothetical protein ACP4OV_031449 [Aristida adscensionis]